MRIKSKKKKLFKIHLSDLFYKIYFYVSLILILALGILFFNTGYWSNYKDQFLNRLYTSSINNYIFLPEILIKKINFPMVADPTGNISRSYGVMIEEEGLTLRGTFIIDPDSNLKTVEIHDNSIGRDMDELLRKLQAAQFVNKYGDQVCPANWKPGKDTLKPGLDLVGKI